MKYRYVLAGAAIFAASAFAMVAADAGEYAEQARAELLAAWDALDADTKAGLRSDWGNCFTECGDSFGTPPCPQDCIARAIAGHHPHCPCFCDYGGCRASCPNGDPQGNCGGDAAKDCDVNAVLPVGEADGGGSYSQCHTVCERLGCADTGRDSECVQGCIETGEARCQWKQGKPCKGPICTMEEALQVVPNLTESCFNRCACQGSPCGDGVNVCPPWQCWNNCTQGHHPICCRGCDH